MPAIPARIGFVLREFRTVEAVSALMKARYGDVARDPKDEPFESFFDSSTDAQALVNERLALVGDERRRFSTEVKGSLALSFNTVTPAATLIDDERQANMPCAIVAITEDAGNDKTTVMLWG
ncbi:hypothetical protein HRJ34_14975 [Rhizorhabdus wittichii]|uniref:Uncharacterized protein n=1 Tax=Rhizorhabdus wittichii TaxID=160791 RepID=A0A975D022_9SPHN|nr:hypothetical protein [Rhizorhabdus wittichii]QTH19676.1 hypothetical protein HRJ34_14975 [Rhizorhabdus wittichii]